MSHFVAFVLLDEMPKAFGLASPAGHWRICSWFDPFVGAGLLDELLEGSWFGLEIGASGFGSWFVSLSLLDEGTESLRLLSPAGWSLWSSHLTSVNECTSLEGWFSTVFLEVGHELVPVDDISFEAYWHLTPISFLHCLHGLSKLGKWPLDHGWLHSMFLLVSFERKSIWLTRRFHDVKTDFFRWF